MGVLLIYLEAQLTLDASLSCLMFIYLHCIAHIAIATTTAYILGKRVNIVIAIIAHDIVTIVAIVTLPSLSPLCRRRSRRF